MPNPNSLMRLTQLLLPIALLTCFFQSTNAQQKPSVIFLVRHAEKVDDSKDPKLSTVGESRAALLAKTLRDSNVKHVYSTNFTRTRKTAKPFANQSSLNITQYDPRNLATFAKQLKSTGGRHLVVGHSNTTPQLVKLLGGNPGSKIEENEYDRLYIVSISEDGIASTVLIRFGSAFARSGQQESPVKQKTDKNKVPIHDGSSK